MDQFMADVTDIPGVAVGDEVELIGEDITAEEIAELQRSADKAYYERSDQSQSDYLLVQVDELKSLANKLGISKKVYEEAYKIYDFRNSGKVGYTLKDGKIIEDPTYTKSRDNTPIVQYYMDM